MSPWDIAVIGTKALLYAGTYFASGGAFFMFYNSRDISVEQRRSILTWVGFCITVALLSTVARPFVISGSMGEGMAGLRDPAMLRMVLQGAEARATGLRTMALLVMGALLLVAPRRLWLNAVAGIFATLSFAWVGHAWARGSLPVALLSIHLLAVAFWLGALGPLRLIARSGDVARLALSAARFGKMALIGVFILMMAGGSLLWIFLSRISDLWLSDYGRGFIVKLGALSALLGVAAFNKLRLTPGLLAHDPRAVRRFRISLRLEMLLGGLILLATATLTTIWSP